MIKAEAGGSSPDHTAVQWQCEPDLRVLSPDVDPRSSSPTWGYEAFDESGRKVILQRELTPNPN
jgi:hypothetical protein